MSVLIALLRGVNVGGHNKIKMDALRGLCSDLGHLDSQTYVQSGNVVFRTQQPKLDGVAECLEEAIHKSAGFRPSVILRTTDEMRKVVAQKPFAAGRDLDPGKLLVTFLRDVPERKPTDGVSTINPTAEEVHIIGREVYVYFPDGIARPKLNWAAIGKMLGTPGTARNWNTVNKLFEMAEKLEGVTRKPPAGRDLQGVRH